MVGRPKRQVSGNRQPAGGVALESSSSLDSRDDRRRREAVRRSLAAAPEAAAKAREREARSVAIEKAYVHDVYEQISHQVFGNGVGSRGWPKVKQFVQDLEPGSIMCDVGESLDYIFFISSENFNVA